ncbi:MAG: HU family DNA-binding protein [Kiritimatiellia bacterium]
MGATYTKSDLTKELAQTAHVSNRRIELILETLTQIAYREARKGFAVPGICRLDVIHRNARLVRNPQTNETLQIAEHDALRVRPVKRAKDAIAPAPAALSALAAPAIAKQPYTVIPPPVSLSKPSQPPPAPAPAAEEEQLISFRCKQCKQEIEATIEMVGAPNDCPTCGEHLVVPYSSETGTIWYQARTVNAAITTPLPSNMAAMKGRTIRIELPDDL